MYDGKTSTKNGDRGLSHETPVVISVNLALS